MKKVNYDVRKVNRSYESKKNARKRKGKAVGRPVPRPPSHHAVRMF